MLRGILYRWAVALSAIGAVNWGIFGVFRVNPVHRLLGGRPRVERAVYLAVGVAGAAVGAAFALPLLFAAPRMGGVRRAFVPEDRSLVGKTLPALQGTTLSGRRVTLPGDGRGKLTFLALGFSYDARWNVENWVSAFQDRFGQYPDVTFFEVPVIGGVYRWFGPMIDAGMRRGTPRELFDRVVPVYADPSALREELRAFPTSDTWIYLVDGDGRVLFQFGGPFDERAFSELAWRVESSVARAEAAGPTATY